MENWELIKLAEKAREFSCSSISGFKVGAALLTKDGRVFTGCNIEDPSGIGVTNICAERCAVIKALSEGCRDFEKIAIVGGAEEIIFCTPCGACRQYLNSFGADITVVCTDGHEIREFSAGKLLPFSFDEQF